MTGNGMLIDGRGSTWEIRDDHLKNEDGLKLDRLPSHRILWFAWYNSYPTTRLVK